MMCLRAGRGSGCWQKVSGVSRLAGFSGGARSFEVVLVCVFGPIVTRKCVKV